MLHIILLILKIIGIVLLCVLGLLILVLVSVLFVPVRYRIEVMREEGEDKPPVMVRAKATWFLHLLNILISYPADVIVRVRLMIFTLSKKPAKKSEEDTEPEKKQKKKKGSKKDKKVSGKEKKEASKAKNDGRKNADKPTEETLLTETNGASPKETSKERAEELSQKTKSVDKEKVPTVTIKALQKEKEEEDTEESPSWMDKIRALPVILHKIIQKIKNLFENIQYTIQNICDKIKSILDNIQYYKEVVESDIFQNTYELCKGELAIILRSLKPQKFEAEWIVGMDDPASTGQILAICGMLYPVFGGHVAVTGDFERKRIEGYVFIKGKIRIFTLLRVVVRIYFNKDVKRTISLLKKEAV